MADLFYSQHESSHMHVFFVTHFYQKYWSLASLRKTHFLVLRFKLILTTDMVQVSSPTNLSLCTIRYLTFINQILVNENIILLMETLTVASNYYSLMKNLEKPSSDLT